MDRKQKIKALELIAKGTPPQKAVKLATMPMYMVFFSKAETKAFELEFPNYDGTIVNIVKHVHDGKGGHKPAEDE